MQNKIEEFHTGFFLDHNKSRVLLVNVQDLLRKYHLVAVTGPQLSNRTSEVLLRPLGIHPLGVNIAGAQVLLEKYLSMVKDSRPKMFIQKEPELIDLESSDDEAMDEASVIIVDLDESVISDKGPSSEVNIYPSKNLLDADSVDDSHNKQNSPLKLVSPSVSSADASKNSQGHEKVAAVVNVYESEVKTIDTVKKTDSSPKSPISNSSRVDVSKCSQVSGENNTPFINNFYSDVIFVDSVKQNSPPKSPTSNNDTGDVLKDSNKQAKKRKIGLEKENAKDVEVVEILDDDIIVLDDTLTTYNPSKTRCRFSEPEVFVVEHTTEQNTVQTLPQRKDLSNSSCTISGQNTFSCLPQPETSQSTSVHQTVAKSSENECENSNRDKTQDPGPPKKKSKLAYHRPAHLVTPLTQPTLAVPSTKTDSVTNIYNPNADSTEKRTGLRPIVIDGNNVAIGYGKGTFSLKGIQICVNFFEKRGHRQIKVFIPQYRKNRDNHDELQKMERKGLIVVTPSRKVNGKVVASYDDRYIVQYAAEFGGVIVSTDNFRDLLSENQSWRETIENRLLMFTWVDDLLMFPQDPLGRRGPSLDDFLKFPDT